MYISPTLNSFLCNIGPQHPSTHGVLRLLTVLHGEVVKWLQVEVGLLHRGTEKLIEYHGFNQVIGYFDRMDTTKVMVMKPRLLVCLGQEGNIMQQRSCCILFPGHAVGGTTLIAFNHV